LITRARRRYFPSPSLGNFLPWRRAKTGKGDKEKEIHQKMVIIMKKLGRKCSSTKAPQKKHQQ
jgi:hypothetical protein